MLLVSVCPEYAVAEGAATISAHMVLLDKTGSPAPSVGTLGYNCAFSPKLTEVACYILMVERDDLKANCVVDDYFVVLCSVDISWERNWTPPASSSLGLGDDLAMMFGKQDLTDVSFDIGGESFSAHRLVLAARSPVFRAELYGPMAESKMTSITIQDMETSTFGSLLHYMYHGSLPGHGKNDVPSTMAEFQHLLVAADRYGVDGLKEICEDKLSGNGISIDSVVSMLELAEGHVCPKLKARCLDFLVEGDNFKMVATSGEYLHLMQSFPTLLVEARERFKIAREKPTIMKPPPQKKTRVN